MVEIVEILCLECDHTWNGDVNFEEGRREEAGGPGNAGLKKDGEN